MKIVDRKTFLALPAGTVYAQAKGGACDYDGPFIKDDMRGDNDWWFLSFERWDSKDSADFFDGWDAMRKDGAQFPICEALSNDGLYDADDTFLIYDANDIDKIIQAFTRAKGVA